MISFDQSFAALADPTRRAIVERLAEGEATVQEIARPFSISQPAISRHLKVLEDAGLIETRVEGSARPRRLKPEAMGMLWNWLGQYRALWEAQFHKLDAVLEELSNEEQPVPHDPREVHHE
ncbi:ArsR/SmtB family transcription factor [Devosia sp. Naph2]|uniref:ArsR/SmtB family transcription factor n=1 Tax=Devosia polycyclovorans TaxID=3345148 RepID=UPI0035D00FB3